MNPSRCRYDAVCLKGRIKPLSREEIIYVYRRVLFCDERTKNFIQNHSLQYSRSFLPFRVMHSPANRGRKKASPTPKNRIWLSSALYSTCCTWVGVTRPNINQAQCCLTSVIEREVVFHRGYGHRASTNISFVL